MEAILVALINGIALIIVALVVNRVRKDVKTVEIATNSIKDALVASARAEGLAVGNIQGRKDQKAEDAARK